MEPHKDMNGNILKLGDYVVKEGNEEVDFYYAGNNNQNDVIERTPFTGIVRHIHSSGSRELNLNNEVVQSSGGDKVSYISIRVLHPNRLRQYRVLRGHLLEGVNYVGQNPDIKLRRVDEMEGNRQGWRRYATAQASGEGGRISRTGASPGQSGVEQGGGGKRRRKKRTKKKSRRKKRKTLKKKRKRRKKKRKTRR